MKSLREAQVSNTGDGKSPGERFALLGDVLLEQSATRPKRPVAKVLASLVIHAVLLAALLAIPVLFTDAIDMRQLTRTVLVAPPAPAPPPPPPPPAATVASAPRVKPRPTIQLDPNKLIAPRVIPRKVEVGRDAGEAAPNVVAGVPGGVVGGVPGGQIGGVIGGIVGGVPGGTLLKVEPPQPKAPVRVGGNVRSPTLIAAPQPIYPPLARQAGIHGNVVVEAVIDENGNVEQMNVLSGHPVLVPAALEALRQWKYQPTVLNGTPVAVQLTVTIKFSIG